MSETSAVSHVLSLTLVWPPWFAHLLDTALYLRHCWSRDGGCARAVCMHLTEWGVWLPTAALLTHQQHSRRAACSAFKTGAAFTLFKTPQMREKLHLRQMESKLCAVLWWMEQTQHKHKDGAWFSRCISCFFFSRWCVSRDVCKVTVVCVSWEWRRFSVIRPHQRLIYPAAGARTPWKAASVWFPLPAERFRELTVKPLMFFKWPVVIFPPSSTARHQREV